VSRVYDEAILEWIDWGVIHSYELIEECKNPCSWYNQVERIIKVKDDDVHDYCVCGTFIRECCIIINEQNGKKLVIGNECINNINNINLNDKTVKQNVAVFKELKEFRNYDNIKKINYAKHLKTISPKTIKYMFRRKLITQDDIDFLTGIHGRYVHKNKIKIGLDQLERIVGIRKKLYEYTYSNAKYDSFKTNYTVKNIIFDNTNSALIKNYGKKYNIILNKPKIGEKHKYKLFIDGANRIMIYLLQPVLNLNYIANYELNMTKFEYKRGFLFFQWRTDKIINTCRQCKFFFFCCKNEKWKTLCKSCYLNEGNSCVGFSNKKHNFSKEEYNVHADFICSECKMPKKYNKIQREIIDENKLTCEKCYENRKQTM